MALVQELSDLGWPRALITLAERDTLPADNKTRVGCVEGMVVTMSAADDHHPRVMTRVWAVLDAARPADREVVAAVDVTLVDKPPAVRVPDVSVGTWLDHMDREHAAAGVADCCILDFDELEPSTCELSTFGLGLDGYTLTGEHDGAAVTETCGVTVSLDVACLV